MVRAVLSLGTRETSSTQKSSYHTIQADFSSAATFHFIVWQVLKCPLLYSGAKQEGTEEPVSGKKKKIPCYAERVCLLSPLQVCMILKLCNADDWGIRVCVCVLPMQGLDAMNQSQKHTPTLTLHSWHQRNVGQTLSEKPACSRTA